METLDCVMDDHKVDERQLPNVQVQITLEDALPIQECQYNFDIPETGGKVLLTVTSCEQCHCEQQDMPLERDPQSQALSAS